MLIGIDASRVHTSARTGTETYSRELIAHLIPLAAREGARLVLYTRAPLTPHTFRLDAWPSHVAQEVIRAPRLWTHVGLAAHLRRHPPDVLFIPAHVVPLRPPPGLPIAVTVHDLGYEYFPETHPWRQRAYLRWSTRHSARRADLVFADSEATARDLHHLYHIPREKIVVAYPGPPALPDPLPSPEEVRATQARYGLTPPYFLFIGTLHPRKNLLRLLDAFARVVSAGDDDAASLALAGKVGWLAEPILARAQAPDLRDRVRILGYVPDRDLAALLMGAVALVYPSLHEGFGFPVLEAQSLGVPVLTAATSSLPEVAGDAALYVDPFDVESIAAGLVHLLQDPDLRADLARRGRANVGRFSWERTATQALQGLLGVTGYRLRVTGYRLKVKSGKEGAASTRRPHEPSTFNFQPLTLNLQPVTILGVRVHRLTFAQALAEIERMIAAGEKGYIVTANPEIIMRAFRDPAYREVLNNAVMAWPDGVGVLMAARLLGAPIPERVTGSDGVPMIAARAARMGWRLYLLGARPGVAARAADVLRQRSPGVDIVGAEPGDPAPEHDDELVARINAARPDILLVAYGAPKQEWWMARNIERLNVRVAIGVGGTFDFLAGTQRRAPRVVRKAGFEWLWRLVLEPWRWRRQLAIPAFVWHVVRQWWRARKNVGFT